MTPYALLAQACGLSHREAAALHDVRIDTIKSWSAGRNRAPNGALADLRRLYAAIARAADEASIVFERAPAALEIGYPADDYEAQALGFPCVGAWRAMCGIVIAELDRPVKLVPRGSTVSTAAAAQAHPN